MIFVGFPSLPPPATRAAFVDAIAEVPADADPIFTMTVTDDLLVRSAAPTGQD